MKVSRLCAKAQLVFHWCLYNKQIYHASSFCMFHLYACADGLIENQTTPYDHIGQGYIPCLNRSSNIHAMLFIIIIVITIMIIIIISRVTLSFWANPSKRELCPVAALFVWLLITGLLNIFVSLDVFYAFPKWLTLSRAFNFFIFVFSLQV